VASGGRAQPVRSATRRDSTDAVRIVLGLAVLAWAFLTATSAEPSTIEINLFRLINQLPGAAGAPLIGIMQLGALPAVSAIVLVCFLGRRVRLARLLAVGGTTAWIVAKALAPIVAQRPPDERFSGVVLHGAVTPGLAFPSTHVAVAAGLATVASPYLSRSGRRSTWLLVGAVAVARIYVGAHLPVDVIGGFAVGWVVGSVLHLVLGAPRGLPDPRALSERLRAIGHPMAAVEPLSGARGSFRLQEPDGTMLHMRVVDRDRREADWLCSRNSWAPSSRLSPTLRTSCERRWRRCGYASRTLRAR
jgi:membrane-associated phospholipid phosphatase